MAIFDGMCAEWDIEPLMTCDVEGVVQAKIDRAVEQAVTFVNDVTCGRFSGPCSVVVRPHLACSRTTCTCHASWPRLDLQHWVSGPIVAVSEVTIDGEVLPTSNYHLWHHRYLSPLDPADGSANPLYPWPRQNMRRLSGDGVWTITLTHGEGPPPLLLQATADLASQLLDFCCGRDCDLPDNAASISRQGVSVSLQARQEGKVGINRIDMVLERYGCPKVTGGLRDPLQAAAGVSQGT